MSSKKSSSLKSHQNRSTSSSKSKPKSTRKEKLQSKTNLDQSSNLRRFEAKPKGHNLVKKKIQDLKAPQLIIKASYKNKKLSILIGGTEEQGLADIMNAHISRFEREILRNLDFDYKEIECWRTIAPGDPLKDYYLQSGKSLQIFKGQVLEIQPVWRKQKKDPVTLQDFQFIRCLGLGGFSRVYVARYLPTGKFFALKLMDKEKLVKTGKQCVVENERDLMVELDSPYVQKLYFAFETKFFMVLGLEYCPGGELFYHLKKVRKMNQDQARFCFLEILLGIQHLHSKNIIYRDIKPENILIDQDGHLKIADFGLSRVQARPDELSYTYCGSAEYMAPEMLNRQGHSFSIDYYCLGALLYEMVTGFPPFYCDDPEQIAQSIRHQQVTFPPFVNMSQQIKELMEGLLRKDPSKRLGSLGGIKEILGHPWVRKLKISQVIERKIQTPLKVDLLTYNVCQQEITQMDQSFEDWLKKEKLDFEPFFQEFYFNRYDSCQVLEAFHTAQTDCTKENKNQSHKEIRNKSKQQKKSGFQSHNREALSYPIKIKHEAGQKGLSQMRNTKPKHFPLDTTGSRNKILQLQSGERKGTSKTKPKSEKKSKNKSKDRISSPTKPAPQGKGLKRIKSSAGLHQKHKQKVSHIL